MATQLDINEEVILTMDLLWQPNVPKMTKEGSNPRYLDYINVYLEVLGPFPIEDIRGGMLLLKENWTYRGWPAPAKVSEFCVKAQKEREEKEYIARPRRIEAPEIMTTKEERLAMADKCGRVVSALTSGRDMHSEETRRWVYGR